MSDYTVKELLSEAEQEIEEASGNMDYARMFPRRLIDSLDSPGTALRVAMKLAAKIGRPSDEGTANMFILASIASETAAHLLHYVWQMLQAHVSGNLKERTKWAQLIKGKLPTGARFKP